MKKNIILSVALAAATTMGLVSCDKSSPKMDDKTLASAQKSGECAKIAYVEVDSIMTQYKFCKEYSKILETKGNNCRPQPPTSSRRFSRTHIPASRQRPSRLACRSRTTTCRCSTSV